MFIETWVLIVLVLFMGASGIVSVLGWWDACGRNDALRDELEEQAETIAELKKENTWLKIRQNVQVASDYYNKGE